MPIASSENVAGSGMGLSRPGRCVDPLRKSSVQVCGERLEQVAVVKLDLVGHAMLPGIIAGWSKSVIMVPVVRSSRERCVLVIATKHSFWR